MHNYAYKCVLLRLISRVIARGCDHAERQVSWLFIYCSFLLNVCFSVMLFSSSSSSSSSSALPPPPSSSSYLPPPPPSSSSSSSSSKASALIA